MKKYIGFLIVLSFLVFGFSQVKALVNNNLPVSDCLSTTTPSITVLSPNGGEVYQAGQQITVKWKSCNFTPSISAGGIDIKISLSAILPSGENPTWTLSQSSGGFSANDGEELITLPVTLENGTSLPYGKNFKIYVSRNDPSAQMPGLGDLSNNLFTINNPGIINTNPTKPFIFGRDLQVGSKGEDVKALQNTLIQKGFLVGKADGTFGNQTLTAIQKLQIANGFTSTSGTFGPKTRALLNSAIAENTSIISPTITPPVSNNFANCNLSVSLVSGTDQTVSKGTNNVTIAKFKLNAQGCDIVVPEIISGNDTSGDTVGCSNYRIVTDKTTKQFTDFSDNFGEGTYIAGFPSYDDAQNLVILNGQSKTISVVADAISTGAPGSSYGVCFSNLESMVALKKDNGTYNMKIGNLPIMSPITKVQ